MQTIALYLLKVIICSGLLLGYYWLALRNKRFHYYNRFYLLMAVVISMLLPLLHLQWFNFRFGNSDNKAINLLNVITVYGGESSVTVSAHRAFNWPMFACACCAVFTLIMLGILLFRIVKIYRLKRMYPSSDMGGFDLINTDLQQAPFSFLNNLFWRRDIALDEATGQQILKHELTHIKQKHTWDKLFMQVALAVYWMNPFYLLIQRELYLIHEFIADEKAVQDKDAAAFATMLLKSQYGDAIFAPAQSFNYSPIKRRLIMLTTSKQPSYSYTRKIMALPLLALVLCLFAFKIHKNEVVPAESYYSGPAFKLILDAGHGGSESGSLGINGVKEKDLTLQLAKKIKDLSGSYGIEVVLTRNDDSYPSAQDRTKLANEQKGDALISLHLQNTTETKNDKNSGMDIYISQDNSRFGDSKILGSAIIETVSKNFKISKTLMQRQQQGIWVLKGTQSPSILIECGFIDNKADVEVFSNDIKEENLARKILEGVTAYAKQKSTSGLSASNSTTTFAGNLEFSVSDLDSTKKFGTKEVKNINFTPDSATDSTNKFPSKVLFVVEGKIVDKKIAMAIDPTKIESVNVIKDKTAVDKYGDKASDGVIEMTLKDESDKASNIAGERIDIGMQNMKTITFKGNKNDSSFKNTLVIVDGKPSNDIKSLNPADIESMSVLKGESATSLYGDKGKDGVILITLKKADQKNKAVITTRDMQLSDVPPVEVIQAKFPGGTDAWVKYLQRYLHQDVPVKRKAPSGRYTVIVSFKVDTDGNLSDIKAIADPGFGTAEEAVRVIKRGPKWIPAQVDGKNVTYMQKQTITFEVSE